MQQRETVVVLDFGGQYNQLITRRIRECQVYSELLPGTTSADKLKQIEGLKGIVFSGGPNSVYGENAPKMDPAVFELGVPILGICYGMQLLAHHFGAEVMKAPVREYGKASLRVSGGRLFSNLPGEQQVWMSHTDKVMSPPAGFQVDATTESCPVAAMSDVNRHLYAVQFHPEVKHSVHGQDLLRNFLFEVCGCKGEWTSESFVQESIEAIRAEVGSGRVLCALSGGVDSSVAAVMIHKAIGDQLQCVFVDHGLLRKGEAEAVMDMCTRQFHMNILKVDARDRFLGKLAGVTDPETKRKIIGEEFIRVFEEEARKLGQFDFLAQGTLYTDIVESGTATAATIKSHHNVGGLPADMQFKLLEPLKTLFKDEVRAAGSEMGLADEIVHRQPFPGPGLAIRVIGEVTEENLTILREADWVLRDEIKKSGLEREIWQFFAVLPNLRSVGVMGDERTYAHAIGIRAVTSQDGMTADWARIPYDVLERISTRIVNEVPDVNRVLYDITSKPPSTIEWE